MEEYRRIEHVTAIWHNDGTGWALLPPVAFPDEATEEPDEGNLHVRICGEGAGEPVPLPGS